MDAPLIYFDNSATTAAYPEVGRLVARVLCEDFGNPSSMHRIGAEAEAMVREARAAIAGTLHAKEKEIYFTSGGTESNNWAVIGGAHAMRRRGNRVITSAMEHPSVSEAFTFLEKEGFEVMRIGLRDGALDMDALSEALTPDTILVSIMLVNNEAGITTDPAAISRLVREKAPNALYHADAVQAYGKFRLNPKRDGIDLLSASSHKFHGPKGVGFLYRSEKALLLPMILGGGQQEAMRSGTDNVPGIAGMGLAAKTVHADLEENAAKMRALRDRLRAGLAAMPDVRIHGNVQAAEGSLTTLPGDGMAPHIVNAAFMGVGAEVLLHALEDKGIMISAGSACSTHKKTESPTLTALGLSAEEKSSSVRFSFCEWNTEEEVDTALAAIDALLPVLRRYRAH